MNIIKTIITTVILLLLGNVYRKYGLDYELDHYSTVDKYLINDIDGKNPYLWIHTDRNDTYKNITTLIIIEKCKLEFNIQIIDDNKLSELTSNGIYNIDNLNYPEKENYRKFGLTKLIQIYGGICIPNNFICFRSLRELFDKGGELFFDEKNKIIGGKKGGKKIEKYIKFMESKIKGHQIEPTILDLELLEFIKKHKYNILHGEKIAHYNIEYYFKYDDYVINKNSFGAYIDDNELKQRTNYIWFGKLTEDEIINSNNILSKMLRELQ